MTPGADMTDAIARVLAESSVRGAVLAMVVGTALLLLRPKRAALRLGAWTIVLYAALAMPALWRLLPAVRVPMPLPAEIAVAPASSTSLGPASPVFAGPRTESHFVTTSSATATASPSSRAPARTRTISPVVVATMLYLVGVVFLLLRAAAGWLVTRRLERSSVTIADRRILARVRSHAARAGLVRSPRLAESAALSVPVTSSVVRQMIVLPADWRSWSDDMLDAVLAHEMSHVARRDTLTQRLSLIYRAILWPNPFAWWLRHRLAELAEQASDEAALQSGIERTTYAETLVGFFTRQQRLGTRAAWHVAMARGAGHSAERRVERILAWHQEPARRLTRRAILGIVVVTTPMLVLAASIDPVRAQPEPGRSSVASLPIAPVGDLSADATAVALTASPSQAASSSVDVAQRQLTTAQVAGNRVWVLLFDVGSLTSADFHAAVDGAQKWFDEKMNGGDIVAIALIGTSLQIVQDFTNDKTKLVDRLKSFSESEAGSLSSTPPAAVANAPRLRALKTLCDGMTQIQQRKAILYFSGGLPASGSIASEMRAVEDACSHSNTSINPVDSRGLSVVIAGGAARQQPTSAAQPQSSPVPGVDFNAVASQKDCPVRLLSTTSNSTDGAYVTATIRNDSSKTVRSVTVAAWVERVGSYYYRGDRFEILASPPLGTWIPSGDTRTLDSHVMDAQALRAFQATDLATLGVVEVDFIDGTKWTYDVRANGGFGPGPPAEPASSPAPTQGQVYRPGPGITSPIPISQVMPVYTPEAMQAKLQGDVEVEAVVLSNGAVGDVTVVKSLDSLWGLDQAAMRAAKLWIFKPAMKDGVAVSMIVDLSMEFRLGNTGAWALAYRPGTPGLVAPLVKTWATPKYTSDAMRAKLQGDVLVDALISAEGKVIDVRITQSLDKQSGLDREAIAAAMQFTFTPATLNGKPVAAIQPLVIEFRLHRP